jgi:hypothetical protein
MRGLVLLAAVLAAPSIAAGGLEIGGDGWHSWRVNTHDGMKDWCCFSWSAGQATGTVCDLDGRRSGYTVSDRERSPTGEMQIYTLIERGTPREIRTLSPDCPVRTESPIKDLGLVDPGTSFDWLRDHASPHSNITADALIAIAVHEGPAPREELLRIALNDKNADSREAAVFALSQLPTDQAVDLLIKVVEQNGLDLQTRRGALFWLAQSDSDRMVDYFSKLLASR